MNDRGEKRSEKGVKKMKMRVTKKKETRKKEQEKPQNYFYG